MRYSSKDNNNYSIIHFSVHPRSRLKLIDIFVSFNTNCTIAYLSYALLIPFHCRPLFELVTTLYTVKDSTVLVLYTYKSHCLSVVTIHSWLCVVVVIVLIM